MITGCMFVTTEEVMCDPSSVELFDTHNENLQYSCFSGVGLTYVVTSTVEDTEKISELVRFKFDYSVSNSIKVFLVWTTKEQLFSRAMSCDDIESDSKRFYQLSEHLIKGVK